MTARRQALGLAWATELLWCRASSGVLDPLDVAISCAAMLVISVLARSAPDDDRPERALAAALFLGFALPGWWGSALAPYVAVGLLVAVGLAWRIRFHLAAIPLAGAAGALVGGAPHPAGLLLSALLAVAAPDRRPWFLLGFLALVPTPRPGTDDPRPDLILVTVDALRADGALPSLEGGTTWQAWAPSPWTLPSMASLTTGQPPHVHGAGRAGTGFVGPTSSPALARRLSEAGYRTIALSAGNPFTGQDYGLAAGFDETWHPWSRTPEPMPRGRSAHSPARPLAARLLRRLPPPDDDADAMVERALTRLAADDGPRFIWLHLMDVHLPHADPPCRPDVLGAPGARTAILADPWWVGPEGRACLEQSYSASVARVDRALARLPAHAIRFVTADHGEALGADGSLEHGHALSAEVLRIPLWSSVGLPATAFPVTLTDLTATLLELGGALHGDLPGRPLTGPIGSKPIRFSSTLYGPESRGVLVDPWLHVSPPPTTTGGEGDPPDLSSLLPPLRPEPAPARIDPGSREALEALGYLAP